MVFPTDGGNAVSFHKGCQHKAAPLINIHGGDNKTKYLFQAADRGEQIERKSRALFARGVGADRSMRARRVARIRADASQTSSAQCARTVMQEVLSPAVGLNSLRPL